jgi:two-component system cell cycle sensor histidine kinase/response regulator CckA
MASRSSVDASPIRVLLVEDDEEDYLLTRRLLNSHARSAFELTWARDSDAGLRELRKPHDACLVDYRLGAESGLAFIERATTGGFRGPMILLTRRGDHEVDVEAMRAGASDYLVKDEITPLLVERVIRHSIERKGAEEALHRSEEQLRQSQKMEAIGSLAGGVAHDFNNLLSVILSHSRLLADGLNPGDPTLEGLQAIREAGLRAAALTRQLLAFSRQQVLKPRVVDLNGICAGIEAMLRRVIGEDVEFTSVAGPKLLKIMVDPGQMEQVIMNLAVNARDAMPEGGTLTIETANVTLDARDEALSGTKPGPHVMLTVTDTGVGMDTTTQARMFEPFFTTKEVGKGTGLGLSTVFGIVKQSGGTISASSVVGRGTVFRIYFPVTDASDSSVSRPVAVVPDGPLRGTGTILVVEDEERVRNLACIILRKYGYQVLEAPNGADALALSEQHPEPIDLLLTDVVMPRMSGPQLAERLVAARPTIKVLYMSGYIGGLTDQQASLVSGAEFLQKPITPETLAQRVQEVLASEQQPLITPPLVQPRTVSTER